VSGRAGEASELRGWAAGGVVAGGHMEIEMEIGSGERFFFFLELGSDVCDWLVPTGPATDTQNITGPHAAIGPNLDAT
jgi:hypothetical protein